MHGTYEFHLLPGSHVDESSTDQSADAAPAYKEEESDFGPSSKDVFVKKGTPSPDSRPGRIVARVKKYIVNGGVDMKFDNEEFPRGLEGKLSYRDFMTLVDGINEAYGAHRTKSREVALLFGLTLLYMPFFVSAKKKRSKKRKALVKDIFEKFNEEHPMLRIRIDRASGELLFQEWTEDRIIQ